MFIIYFIYYIFYFRIKMVNNSDSCQENESSHVITLKTLKQRREKNYSLNKNLTSLICSKMGNQEVPTDKSVALANCDTFSTSSFNLMEKDKIMCLTLL